MSRFNDEEFAREFDSNPNAVYGGPVRIALECFVNTIVNQLKLTPEITHTVSWMRSGTKRLLLEIGAGGGSVAEKVMTHNNLPQGTAYLGFERDKYQIQLWEEKTGWKDNARIEVRDVQDIKGTDVPTPQLIFFRKFIHEIHLQAQQNFFTELATILRSSSGRLVAWLDTMTEENCSAEFDKKWQACSTIESFGDLKIPEGTEAAPFFCRAWEKLKDMAAGNDVEVNSRYFSTINQVRNMLRSVGFTDIQTLSPSDFALKSIHHWHYRLSPMGNLAMRLDGEQAERVRPGFEALQRFTASALFDGDQQTDLGKRLRAQKVNKARVDTVEFDARFDLLTARVEA